MNGKTSKGPDLPMPISDACFVKINETFAILIGNYLSKVWTLKNNTNYILAGHFTTISGPFFVIYILTYLSQNWDSEDHFEVLNLSKP